MINWSLVLKSKFSVFTPHLSCLSKVVNYLIFQHHLLWAISKINTVQYSLLILSRFLLWIKMSMQQAFRDYFSTQYLYTFLFYWCLINHQMWLLNFTISSKMKRIVDLLWYYWEFNFNVDVGRREDLDLRCEKMTLLGKPGNFSQIVLPVFKGSCWTVTDLNVTCF